MVAAFAAVVVFLVVAYVDVVRRGTDRGITSEAAFLITFLLGALSVAHDIIPQGGRRVFTVLGAAVAVTALLSSKPVVQPLIRRLSREDVVSVLKFLIVALLLVPWLPDRDFGPLGVAQPPDHRLDDAARRRGRASSATRPPGCSARSAASP